MWHSELQCGRRLLLVHAAHRFRQRIFNGRFLNDVRLLLLGFLRFLQHNTEPITETAN
jgi:hypothetical protein